MRRPWRASDPPRPGAELPVALRHALADLESWAPPGPDWEPLRQKLARVLVAAFAVPGSPIPALDTHDIQTGFLLDRMREGWREGVPAVRVVPPALDHARLLERISSIDRCNDLHRASGGPFRDWLARQPEQVTACAGAMLLEGEEAVLPRLEPLEADAEHAVATLRLSLLGELGDWSSRIVEELPAGFWTHGHCPVCGARPALGEWRGLEQRQFLRCECCGAGWPVNRLQCPFCGGQDHRGLHSLFAEHDQQRCRLLVCDSCGGRLKILATLSTLTPPGLIVAQFTTLYLDFVAEGGRPPAPCPWRRRAAQVERLRSNSRFSDLSQFPLRLESRGFPHRFPFWVRA